MASPPSLERAYLAALKTAAKTRRQSSGEGRISSAERSSIKAKAVRSARAKVSRMKMSSDVTDIDKIAKLFGLPTSEDFMKHESEAYVNGVDYFHFGTLKEFLDSGPYSGREAVLNHIGYIPQWAEVYGDTDARRIYESHVR